MSKSIIDSDRQVIPRWRNYPVTKKLGELGSDTIVYDKNSKIREESFNIKKTNGQKKKIYLTQLN